MTDLLPELKQAALDRLLSNLIGYGNSPGPSHIAALGKLCEVMLTKTFGLLEGRHAVPLGCGMGKSQSIAAVVATLFEAGLLSPESGLSIAVCQSTVEALCELKRELIKNGVPCKFIGLKHSFQYSKERARVYLSGESSDLPKDFASEESTQGNGERPILLCTHNRIRGKSAEGLSEFYHYRGTKRSLLVWDESLLVSDSNGIALNDIRKSLAVLSIDREGRSKQGTGQRAVDYVQDAVDVFRKSLLRQKDGADAEAIKLPSLTDAEIVAFKEVFKSSVHDEVREFLEISQNDLRCLYTPNNQSGVVNFEVAVPGQLSNVLILDASHNIRELVKLDRTIETVPGIPENLVECRVTVNQLFRASGRHSLSQEIASKNPTERKTVNEVCEVVKGIPADQGIIFFVFKPKYWSKSGRELNFRVAIEKKLSKDGIDTRATLVVNGKKKPRFVFLHHGNECGHSRFSYCKNVIFMGVLHRSRVDIGASMVGQVGDLTCALPISKQEQVYRSEINYCLHQGINRSACRIIDGDKTKEAEVWMVYDKDVREVLGRVMPGAVWRSWEPKFGGVKECAEMALRLSNELDLMESEGVTKISNSALKYRMRINRAVADMKRFTRALEKAVDSRKNWTIEGRSIRCKTAVDFGFEAAA